MLNSNYVSSSISASCGKKVEGKWMLGETVLPSFGEDDQQSCSLCIDGLIMIMYLLIDFEQVLSELTSLRCDNVEAQFGLALKCENTRVLLEETLAVHSRKWVIAKEELELREKMRFSRRVVVLTPEAYRLEEELAKLGVSIQAIDNPHAFFRVCAELHFRRGEHVVKKTTKPLFLSPVFRLSATRAVVDCLSVSASTATTAPKSLANFLYQPKPWWFWPQVEGAEQMIAAAQQQSSDLKKLTASFVDQELQIEDTDPSVWRERQIVLRVKISSAKYERLKFMQQQPSAAETPELKKLAPLLCPGGQPKRHTEDGFWLRILSTTGLQPMSELTNSLEVVVVDDTGTSLSEQVVYKPQSASFWVPSSLWHWMVPARVFKAHAPPVEDREESLCVLLRMKDDAALKKFHRAEFVPYFQLRWTDLQGGTMYSDSPANRCVKVKFDFSTLLAKRSLVDGNVSLAKCAIPKKQQPEEASLQTIGELAKDILEAPKLRQKIQELELQQQQQQQQLPTPSPPPVSIVVPQTPPSVNIWMSLKAELGEWIRSDPVVSGQTRCVKLLTCISHSVVDELKSIESWTDEAYLQPSASRMVPMAFRKKSRMSATDPVVWQQAKDVFEAWLQACLQHMHDKIVSDDVEGLRLFLKESFGNNQTNPAYNASVQKCMTVHFSHFSKLCRKLKESIEKKSVLFR